MLLLPQLLTVGNTTRTRKQLAGAVSNSLVEKESFTNENAIKIKTDAIPKFFNNAFNNAMKNELKNELRSVIKTNEGIITFKAQPIEWKFGNLKRYPLHVTSLGKFICHIFPKPKILTPLLFLLFAFFRNEN